jgi:hypothetical protein
VLRLTTSTLHIQTPRLPIALLKPGLRGVSVRKDLQVVLIANLIADIDINPDSIGHEKESMTRPIAGCCRFLTLTQCGERPAR